MSTRTAENSKSNIRSDQPGETPAGGYINLWRRIFAGPLWNEKRVFSKFEAWIDLVQMARWQDDPETRLINGQLVKISRGQLAASIRFLGERWSWDKNKVNRYLLSLEKDDAIRRPETQAETVLELINYEFYNKTGQQQGQEVGQENPLPVTISRKKRDSKRDIKWETNGTDAGHARDKCNKENKENNKKKEIAFPFSSFDFLKKWSEWKEYRASEHKFKFKSSLTEQAALNHLKEISNNSEMNAMAIIQHSIAMGWKGLFELKESKVIPMTGNYPEDPMEAKGRWLREEVEKSVNNRNK